MERKPDHKIDKLFINRWSPRSFTGGSITKEQLMELLEAARWAPSCFNEQPWRIIYGFRGTPAWDKLFSLMGEFNQGWTKNCSALGLIVSRNTFNKNDKPNKVHSFDCGSWWMSLALQARMNGLYAHGMAGFDYEKAQEVFSIPSAYTIEAMFAVGIADAEKMKAEEISGRKKVEEFAFEGEFQG